MQVSVADDCKVLTLSCQVHAKGVIAEASLLQGVTVLSHPGVGNRCCVQGVDTEPSGAGEGFDCCVLDH